MRCWGKKESLIGELADRQAGRLAPQNNHLIGVWMPDSLIDQRERNNEKLKSKGRTERKRQWESQVKGSSVLPDISKGMASCWKGCVNLFCSQVNRDKLSLHELNQGTLVYSQIEGQGPPGELWSINNNKQWSIDYSNKSKKKKKQVNKSFQHGVRIGFLPATFLQFISHKM